MNLQEVAKRGDEHSVVTLLVRLGGAPLPKMSLQYVRMSSSSASCESSADSVVTLWPLSAASMRLSRLWSMQWR
jgi:hypothetical protein